MSLVFEQESQNDSATSLAIIYLSWSFRRNEDFPVNRALPVSFEIKHGRDDNRRHDQKDKGDNPCFAQCEPRAKTSYHNRSLSGTTKCDIRVSGERKEDAVCILLTAYGVLSADIRQRLPAGRLTPALRDRLSHRRVFPVDAIADA